MSVLEPQVSAWASHARGKAAAAHLLDSLNFLARKGGGPGSGPAMPGLGRLKHPLIRSRLLKLWREERANRTPVGAWDAIQGDLAKRVSYVRMRGLGGFVRADWEEVVEIIAAANSWTIGRWGPGHIAGFSPCAAGAEPAGGDMTELLSKCGFSGVLELPREGSGDACDWPRNLFVWGMDSAGERVGGEHDRFLRCLLGPGYDAAGENGQLVTSGSLRPPPLPMLVTLGAHISTICVYSDIVLPVAVRQENGEAGACACAAMIHPQGRDGHLPGAAWSEWEIFKAIAAGFADIEPEIAGMERFAVLNDRDDAPRLVLNFMTPHRRRGVRLDCRNDLLLKMFNCSGAVVWISEADARLAGIEDRDWVEVRGGGRVFVARAADSPHVEDGTIFVHYAQEKDRSAGKIADSPQGLPGIPACASTDRRVGAGDIVQLPVGFDDQESMNDDHDEFVVVRKLKTVVGLDGPIRETMTCEAAE